MDSMKRLCTPLLTLALLYAYHTGYSQTDLLFGSQKIKIPGTEICSFTINKNSHYERCFLEIKNENLWYTTVEYEQNKPVRIEITECRMAELDKSSCSLAASDQKAAYTPGQVDIIYLYTSKDQVSISTTIYPAPDSPATIERSSVGRIYFRDHHTAETCFNTYFK